MLELFEFSTESSKAGTCLWSCACFGVRYQLPWVSRKRSLFVECPDVLFDEKCAWNHWNHTDFHKDKRVRSKSGMWWQNGRARQCDTSLEACGQKRAKGVKLPLVMSWWFPAYSCFPVQISSHLTLDRFGTPSSARCWSQLKTGEISWTKIAAFLQLRLDLLGAIEAKEVARCCYRCAWSRNRWFMDRFVRKRAELARTKWIGLESQ